MLAPLPCGRPRLTTRAPWASATSAVPSVDASSATQSSTSGKAAARASSVAPIRSASLRAATITSTFVIVRGYCPARMSVAVEAHITGTVWKIEVAVGDTVSDGDTVVILESMKMEMPVEVEDDGKVTEIRCEEGQSVQEGDVLVVLE